MAKKEHTLPTSAQLQRELKRRRYNKDFRGTLLSTVSVLLVVAAAAILVSTLFVPVLQATGTSMAPTLDAGDIFVTVRGSQCDRGDICAFYYNNKILVKRVIALGGEVVNIDENGNVSVNGEELDEPYVEEKAFGDCNIELPYKVPDGKIFVMGDHRATSADSRNTAVGCVSDEQMIGRIMLRVWPLESFGKIE